MSKKEITEEISGVVANDKRIKEVGFNRACAEIIRAFGVSAQTLTDSMGMLSQLGKDVCTNAPDPEVRFQTEVMTRPFSETMSPEEHDRRLNQEFTEINTQILKKAIELMDEKEKKQKEVKKEKPITRIEAIEIE